MNEPVKAGDLAIIVWGERGEQSPNIGKIVQVVKFAGEHSLHGRCWLCKGTDVSRRETDQLPDGYFHVAQAWLKKINPPPQPPKTKTKERELEKLH